MTLMVIDELADTVMMTFSDGDIIDHQWLRAALGLAEPDFKGVDQIEESRRASYIRETLNRDQFDYLDAVESLRETLLANHQVAIQNVRGKGYRIVPPGEQTPMAMETLRKNVSRDIRRCNDILTNIRVNLLSDSERRENTDASAKVAFFANLSKKRLLES